MNLDNVNVNFTAKLPFTKDQLLEILEKEYSVRASSVTLLNGYDGFNYLVQEECKGGPEYILKIFDEFYSRSIKEQKGEVALLSFLRDHKFPVPEIINTVNGANFIVHVLKGETGKQRIIRLQIYFPGQLLVKTEINHDISRKLGVLVGQLDAAMSQIKTPTVCAANDKTWCQWDLGHIELVDQFTDEKYLVDDARRSLAKRATAFTKSKLIPNINNLPRQPIHGDINEQNVIVTDDGKEITGIIDFGDALITSRVFEPAIAMTYLILYGTDPKLCSLSFLDGYIQSVHLSELERSLLFPCIIGRFAQSLVFGNYCAHQLVSQGRSTDYVLSTASRGWSMLSQLLETSLGSELAELFENFE